MLWYAIFLDSRLRGNDDVRAWYFVARHSREGGNPGVNTRLIEVLQKSELRLWNNKGIIKQL